MNNRFVFFILVVYALFGCSSNELYDFKVTTWSHGEGKGFQLKNEDMIFEYSPAMRANGVMSDDFLIARSSFSVLFAEEGKYSGTPSLSYSNNKEGKNAVIWLDLNADGNFDGYIANKTYYIFYEGRFYQNMHNQDSNYILINNTKKVCVDFNPEAGRFEKASKCFPDL